MRLAACSSVRLRSACVHRPAPSTRAAGRGADVAVACFFRISPAMRGFCGSRSLRLPGLLPHGILFSCRRGRMSAIAVHRDSLACFSIPIFPVRSLIPNSSPSSTPISGLGHFQSFHARCYWPLLSTRFAPFAYPWRTGQSVFFMRIICDELIKTAPMDAIISVNQSISPPRLVSLPACRVVGRGGCCLLGCVSFPVIFVYFRSASELNIFPGIMRLCCDFLLAYRAGDVIGLILFLSAPRLGFPAARAVPARVMLSVMSSVSAGLLACPIG